MRRADYWKTFLCGVAVGILACIAAVVATDGRETVFDVRSHGSGIQRKLTPDERDIVSILKARTSPVPTTDRGRAIQKCIHDTDFQYAWQLYALCK